MKKHLVVLAFTALLASCGGAKQAPTPEPTESLESVSARANQGDKDAQFQMGAMYHDGQIVQQDFKAAMDWFTKSAAQGDERAQFNLGVMYYIGEGIKQDYAKAKTWFELAAKQKNSRAQFNLGVIHYRGEGVKQDFAQALQYFAESASQGFGEAQFNLGVMYAKGEGVSQDIGKAYAWFTAAKVYGSDKADEAIMNIEKALTPDQLKQVKALADELKVEIEKNVAALTAKASAQQ